MLVSSWVSSGRAKVASALASAFASAVEPGGINKIVLDDSISAATVSPEASWLASRGEGVP